MLFKTLDGLRPATADTDYRYPGVGRWTRRLDPDKLRLCGYGYHYVTDGQVLDWLAATIYEAEPCSEHAPLTDGDKSVTCRLRLVRRFDGWNDRTARLFAADCAERVLPLFEGLYPDDSRPRDAIVAARRFVNGEIGFVESASAAMFAKTASIAASTAASTAAWAAAWAASAASSSTWADNAAASTARAAAWAASAAEAARDASATHRPDARAAQTFREWQYQRLLQYLNGTAGAAG